MDGYLQAQMDFLEACSAGDINKTMMLLGSGRVDINFHHRVNGWTGLHWAARRGHADIVNLLLRTGFDPISQAKDGRTPIDVATEPSIKTILEKYSLSPSTESSSDTVVQLNSSSSDSLMREANNNGLEKGDAYSPPRDADDKGSTSSKKSPADSLDLTASPPSAASPTTPTRKQELYSYGRRDSLDRTRFLLVRTSCGNGKEAFRRITLPGGGSVKFMKLTIERAMKMGTVKQVATLPDRVPIEKDEQIRDLADCQKVEVTFDLDSSENSKGVRKTSLTEKTYSEAKAVKKRAGRIQKTRSMNDDYIAHASADTSFGGYPGDNAHPTLKEQSELDAEQKAAVDSSQLSLNDISEVESFSNQALTAIPPQAGNPAITLPIEEVLSSTAAEEVTLKDNQSEETLRDGAVLETLSSSALQKVVLEDDHSDNISKDDAVHEVVEQAIMEENVEYEVSLTSEDKDNQDAHITLVSPPSGQLSGAAEEFYSNGITLETEDKPTDDKKVCEEATAPKDEDNKEVREDLILSEDRKEVQEDIVASNNSSDIREYAYGPKDSKAEKLVNMLIGDENDPYRPVKVAVLVASVIGVSSGIAYYLFVRVK